MEAIVKGITRTYGYLNDTELWELIKFEIGQFAREYSKMKREHEKFDRFQLYERLSVLQQKWLQSGLNDENLCETAFVEAQIKSYKIVDVKRAMFRCKANWQEGGEKMSKFFFNLEKQNYVTKTMYIVRKSDGSLTKDYREILNLQYQFYDELYTRNENVKFDLENRSGVKLSPEMREWFEQEVSMDEL